MLFCMLGSAAYHDGNPSFMLSSPILLIFRCGTRLINVPTGGSSSSVKSSGGTRTF
jgi:hypothetical protein